MLDFDCSVLEFRSVASSKLPTVAFDTVLVERVALIASATVTADRVLASTVLTHAREFNALVDILTLDEAVPTGTQLRIGLRTRFRTQFALVAAPGTTDGATAEALRKVTLYRTGALTVTVV